MSNQTMVAPGAQCTVSSRWTASDFGGENVQKCSYMSEMIQFRQDYVRRIYKTDYLELYIHLYGLYVLCLLNFYYSNNMYTITQHILSLVQTYTMACHICNHVCTLYAHIHK